MSRRLKQVGIVFVVVFGTRGSPEQQQMLLAVSCQDASEGKMPGPYALLRSETRLSAQDVATICAAADRPDAHAAAGR